MITVGLTTALMLYLCVTLLLLLGLWLANHLWARKKVLLPPKEDLMICEYCHTAYIKDVTKTITLCPGCKSYNQKS